MMTEFLHDWEGGTAQDVLSDFGMPAEALDGAELLVASYSYENYEGSAFVLFRKGDKLFEVHGGHCSCYGLSESDYYRGSESQWKPEMTTPEAVLSYKFYVPGVGEAVEKALRAEGA